MYAIIRDGGHQYKVEEGMELEIEYRDAAQGDKLTLGEVLFVGGDSPVIGKPLVSGASVTAEVLGIQQGPKLVVQKFRRRKNERRRTGHRQMFTRVKIGKISV
jgi:large subunit ribosomal protein L21